MYWLTPGIETYAAYGTCLLLFGLLVLSVSRRRVTERSQVAFNDFALVGPYRPAPKSNSVPGSRRNPTAIQHPGLPLSTGREYTPRAPRIAKAPDSSVNPLAAPLVFPVRHISEEVKMNSSSFPFESPDPFTLTERSGF